MKTKNIILLGIILLTIGYPIAIIADVYIYYTGLSVYQGGESIIDVLPLILYWIIAICVYLIGILTIDLGLKKFIKE